MPATLPNLTKAGIHYQISIEEDLVLAPFDKEKFLFSMETMPVNHKMLKIMKDQ